MGGGPLWRINWRGNGHCGASDDGPVPGLSDKGVLDGVLLFEVLQGMSDSTVGYKKAVTQLLNRDRLFVCAQIALNLFERSHLAAPVDCAASAPRP